MRARRWGSVVALVVIVAVLAPGGVFAQSVDELRQRLQQLENSTREELESLKRLIREGEAEREKKRKVQEEQERVLESLKQQVEEQRLSFEERERGNSARSPPRGRTSSTCKPAGSKPTMTGTRWVKTSRATSSRTIASRSGWAARSACTFSTTTHPSASR